MKPQVTVIMNTYMEKPCYLEEAIMSYQNQQGVDFELLICTIEDDPAIEGAQMLGVPEKNILISPIKGIYQQMNYAYQFAQGEYITYSSSNDKARYFKLSLEFSYLARDVTKYVCYSDYFRFTDDLDRVIPTRFHDYSYEQHLQGNFVSDCSLVHRSLIEKYFPLRSGWWHNDSLYDFWLRVYEGEGNVFVWNRVPTWYYRQNSDSEHLSRSRDPQKLSEYAAIRSQMIAWHRKLDTVKDIPYPETFTFKET